MSPFVPAVLIVVFGVIAALGCGVAWTRTGQRGWLFAMVGAVVLMIAGLIVDRLIVTDREAIEKTLAQIARDVQSNNLRALSRHIYSGAPELQQKAKAELPNYRFEECRITRIHQVEIDAETEPRSAIVEFNVVARGTFKHAGMELTDTVRRWVRLQMVREKDGRWTVQNYEHASPERMMFDEPLAEGMEP